MKNQTLSDILTEYMPENIKIPTSDMLNPSILSFDSVQGVLVAIILFVIILSCIKKVGKLTMQCTGALIIIQICYILGTTSLNAYIPFSSIFKYDLLTSLAQLCVGTKLSDIILTINYVITTAFTIMANLLTSIFSRPLDETKQFFSQNK